jgi:hypothetical protein
MKKGTRLRTKKKRQPLPPHRRVRVRGISFEEEHLKLITREANRLNMSFSGYLMKLIEADQKVDALREVLVARFLATRQPTLQHNVGMQCLPTAAPNIAASPQAI